MDCDFTAGLGGGFVTGGAALFGLSRRAVFFDTGAEGFAAALRTGVEGFAAALRTGVEGFAASLRTGAAGAVADSVGIGGVAPWGVDDAVA